jgi:PAS domain S-box-containing protein
MTNTDTISNIEERIAQNKALTRQNKALQFSKNKGANDSERLDLFFDLASLGFVVLDDKKNIIQINDTGANFLKENKNELINTDFSQYLTEDCLLKFDTFLIESKESKIKKKCKVNLISRPESQSYISISGLYLAEEKNHVLTIKNISKKTQYAKKVKESDYFYGETQKLGVIGSYKINVAADIWQVSDMLKNIFGVNATSTVTFGSWLSIIHPEDIKAIELILQEKIEDKTPFNQEYRIIRQSDGEVRWINTKGAFRSYSKTEDVFCFGLIQDITDRKKAAEIVKNTEIHSKSIFKFSKEGILILDAVTGQITDANPSLIEMIGFNYQELVGKELWEIGVFKNIAVSKEAFIELQNNAYNRFENMPLETKAGMSLDVEFVNNVYVVANKSFIVCLIRDISSRKKTEEALKVSRQFYYAMFEKNQAAQLFINPTTGNIIDANSAATRFYGYSLVQFKAMNLADISSVCPSGNAVAELRKFELEGQSYFQSIHKTASGEMCAVEIFSSLLLLEGKSYLIATINDITKRKNEEERLTQLNHQLKEVNALKSQFISTVSHEFRTPLAGIMSSVQLLKINCGSWDKEKIEKMYRQIFDAVNHTKSLLDDVSLIDAAQNSKTFFRPAYLSLIPLINQIIDENLAIADTNHKVVLKNNLNIDVFFMDKAMVRHILNNLLSNAIKYSDESKIIKVNVDQINSSEIKIIIQDSGIGIPKDEIKNLLEPFYRASNVDAIKGTGFGMSIVQRFVELHKGKIEIESVLHEGTKISIILPFKEQES